MLDEQDTNQTKNALAGVLAAKVAAAKRREKNPLLKDYLIDKALEDSKIMAALHNQLFAEWNNEQNDQKVRMYFRRIYTELVKRAEKDYPKIAQDIKSSVELAKRCKELSLHM